jgi:serine/threonine protein kinase
MELPYSTPIDMWSLACILFEIHFGEPLFKGSSDMDHLMQIFTGLCAIPRDILML